MARRKSERRRVAANMLMKVEGTRRRRVRMRRLGSEFGDGRIVRECGGGGRVYVVYRGRRVGCWRAVIVDLNRIAGGGVLTPQSEGREV